MKCPECGLVDHDNKVKDSRPYKNNTIIKRKRMCNYCNHKWSTYEINEEMYSYIETYRNKTGRREWTYSEVTNLVRLREQDRFTYKVIAEKLGRTPGAVRRKWVDILNSGEYFDILAEIEMKNAGGIKHAN